jgi:hypothetical protein
MRRYIQKHGKWATDERCQCGHARAEHDVLVSQRGEQTVRQDGLGRCRADDCQCRKFRRFGWIFENQPPRQA